jgi:hypothetical protein
MFGKRFESKASNLYASRIFISIPKSGAFFIATAIVVSVFKAFPVMSNAIALVLGLLSLVTVVISRRQVAKLRDEVDFAKRGVSEDIDAPITQDSFLKDFKVNGNHDPDFVRVPK